MDQEDQISKKLYGRKVAEDINKEETIGLKLVEEVPEGQYQLPHHDGRKYLAQSGRIHRVKQYQDHISCKSFRRKVGEDDVEEETDGVEFMGEVPEGQGQLHCHNTWVDLTRDTQKTDTMKEKVLWFESKIKIPKAELSRSNNKLSQVKPKVNGI